MFSLPKSWKDWILPRTADVLPPPLVRPGLYHFQRRHDQGFLRYHLRVDDQGPAVLIAGACEAVLLSPAGAAAAKALLEGKDEHEVERSLPVVNAHRVVEDVRDALIDLGRWDLRYPIFNLVDPTLSERAWKMSAPFQADLVLDNGERTAELIDRLWEARIPHVRLLVTPRTEKHVVVKGVTHAEEIGMIAGVRIAAARWLDSASLLELAEAGLDYLVLPWGITEAAHAELFGPRDYSAFWRVIDEAIRREVTPVADAALRPVTCPQLPAGLDELLNKGIHYVELFAIVDDRPPALGIGSADQPATPDGFTASELRQLAAWIEDLADQRRIQLVWLPPVLRRGSELPAELVRRGPRAGGDITIRVEHDGSVIPPRGRYRVAGNLLVDRWEAIWRDEAFQQSRERTEANPRCSECPGLTICAAECPADPHSWASPR
jgi:radical SAM protein with 4Fe4S-binding SPASM domain